MDTATSEKVAKSMLAMAKISQLIPYYGGEISESDWNDETVTKYYISFDINYQNIISWQRRSLKRKIALLK